MAIVKLFAFEANAIIKAQKEEKNQIKRFRK